MRGPATRERSLPVGLIGTGVLVVVVSVVAATAGGLRFGPARFDLNGGKATPPPITQTPPAATGTPTKPPAAAAVTHTPNLTWVAIVLGALVLAAIVFAVVRWLRSRDRSSRAVAGDLEGVPLDLDQPEGPSVETSAPYLRRGLRRALDVLDAGREPSDAIVEAWLGLQEAAEDAGHQRLDAETPTEFTTRILARMNVDADALDVLRRLYTAVRFGERIATPDDIARARDALQRLSDDWAAPTAAPDAPDAAPTATPRDDGPPR